MSEEREPVVIRDNRKIDPVTGQARKPGAAPNQGSAAGAPQAPPAARTAATEDGAPTVDALLVEERTRDLQRVQAEYANYRRRAERDRLAAGELAIGGALSQLLPVLDDLERATAHGDLSGPLKAVADKLDAAFANLGLVAFGAVGDPFDPARHEAVLHDESDAVAAPTCTTVMRRGYLHHDRLLRPAMVGVTAPITPAPAPSEDHVDGTAASKQAAQAEQAAQGKQTARGEHDETPAPPPDDVGRPTQDDPAATGENSAAPTPPRDDEVRTQHEPASDGK